MEICLKRLVTAGLLLGSAANAATSGPVVLAPAGPWAMDYAEDSCRLARKFGSGDSSVFFYMERFAPSSGQFVLVAGKPLSKLRTRTVGLRFQPGGPTADRLLFWGSHGQFEPALLAPSVALVTEPEGKDEDAEVEAPGPFVSRVPPEREQEIDAFEVVASKKPALRLALGPMGAAFEALRKCTEELVTHWGLDVEAHRHLTRAPTPKGNPGHWVSNDDYPTEAIHKGAQGVIPFRLIVGTDGVPTDCHLQRPTEPAEFNDVVCRILLKRARFEPALDAGGQPIKSYWSSTFNFMIG